MKSSELIGKKIVIAPFSTEAILLYHFLKHDGVEVLAFMDKDKSLHSSHYLGTPIFPYIHFEEDGVNVITTKPGYVEEDVIRNELLYVGYDQDDILRENEIEFQSDLSQIKELVDFAGLSGIRDGFWMRLLKRKLNGYGGSQCFSITALHLVLTTRCTLKCKDCVNLMDYFQQKDQRDIAFDTIQSSFDRLMKRVDYINSILPIGGEPFLYKEIDKLLQLLVSEKYTKKVGDILIVTNGTVVPKKSTLEILGEHRDMFRIWVTDYKRLSPKKLEIFSLLNQYGCDYKNHIHESWYLTNQPVTPPEDLRMEEVKAKCDMCDCCNGGRVRLVGDRVYPCHFLAFAALSHLIPEDKRDYFDISQDNFDTESLRKFFLDVHPGKAYCGSPWNRVEETSVLIPIGEQLSAPRECIRYE